MLRKTLEIQFLYVIYICVFSCIVTFDTVERASVTWERRRTRVLPEYVLSVNLQPLVAVQQPGHVLQARPISRLPPFSTFKVCHLLEVLLLGKSILILPVLRFFT